MRFGAFVPQGWRLELAGVPQEEHWQRMVDVARTIESTGYESLWVFDHFHTVPMPTQEVTYEAWTLMASLAAVTDTVRLGQMCTCNSYRPPSYLAKVASSIDVISSGRVEMGIGAGWYEHEYLGYGYEFPKASVRIGMLREAVEIMQAMWTQDEVTYEGKYYNLNGAINSPKGVQTPHIPFWIAGGGEKLTLNVAARYAQYTNFGTSVEEFVHKSEILAGHCNDVGRDYDEIVRTSNFTVLTAPTESEVQDKVDWLRAHYAGFIDDEDRLDRLLAMWGDFVGTPEQLVEKLRPWGEAGMDYAIVFFADSGHDSSSIELFANEVMPALS
jgi:F420-dependent oxidoreductase-like protein